MSDQKANQSETKPREQTALVVTHFVRSGLTWLVLAGVLCGVLSTDESRITSILWFLGIWCLSMIDLLALGRAIGAVMALSLENDPSKKHTRLVQAFFWGLSKLACLGILIAVLWVGNRIPSTALLLGISTLLVVPLFGGLWWSRKELMYA